jgi:hypothetical protein
MSILEDVQRIARRYLMMSIEGDWSSGGVIRLGIGSFGGGGNWNMTWKLNRGLEEQWYNVEGDCRSPEDDLINGQGAPEE